MKAKTKAPAAGNLRFAQAMHGKHNLTHADKRTKRVRTRSSAKRAALRDFR